MPDSGELPRLQRITVYPLKSFDPVSVDEATVLPSGALQHDRQFALRRHDGTLLTAKRDPRVHRVSIRIDPEVRTVTIQERTQGDESSNGSPRTIHLHIDDNLREFQQAVSVLFSQSLELVEDLTSGFPDDHESPGPTIVAMESLEAVAAWFPGMSVDDVRQRFRANLEVAGCEPFWEDRLFGQHGTTVPFRIGAVKFLGINPCQRCVVPTRDATTGAELPMFAKEFSRRREQTLPEWATVERFDHFYRLTTNTRGVGIGGIIRRGDAVSL